MFRRLTIYGFFTALNPDGHFGFLPITRILDVFVRQAITFSLALFRGAIVLVVVVVGGYGIVSVSE